MARSVTRAWTRVGVGFGFGFAQCSGTLDLGHVAFVRLCGRGVRLRLRRSEGLGMLCVCARG